MAAGTVLVVDDNAVNRDLIARQLARLGYRCVLADGGASAFERWLEGGIALLLTDLRMPDMNGFELCEAVREHESRRGGHTPVIAFSANAYDEMAAECLARGMDDYLPKPVAMGALREALRRWMPESDAGDEQATPCDTAGGVKALPQCDGPPVLDLKSLTEIVGDDPQAVDEVLKDFLEHSREVGAELETSWRERSLDVVRDLAHKLKSSARSVGAERLGELCQRLEQSAQTGDGERVALLMGALAPALDDVQARIRGH